MIRIRRFSALAAALIVTAAAASSCAPSRSEAYSPKITVSSSGAESAAVWLTERLGESLTDELYLSVGNDASRGIDTENFEDDGYFLRSDGDSVIIAAKTAVGLDIAARKYARAVEQGAPTSFDTVYHEGYRIESLTFAGRDISEYAIEYPAAAGRGMRFAVSELQSKLKEACGAELSAAEGITKRECAIEFRISDDESLSEDGYRYFFEDRRLVIESSNKRGSIYGVYRFLRNECGWKQLTFGDDLLEESDHLDIPAEAAAETPAFDFFRLWMHYEYDELFDSDVPDPETLRSMYPSISQPSHGMSRWVDEEFSGSQICYTNEDTYASVRDNIADYLAAKVASGNVPGVDILSLDIAQSDNPDFCKCKDCTAMFSKTGSNSGAVVDFANRLSEELNEEYPGIYYQIFAYWGNNAPPKRMTVSEYVHVTFCTDLCCTAHPADGSLCTGKTAAGVNNKDYASWLRGWLDLTENVYVWHYYLPQHLLQYNVVDDVLLRDFRFFRECGVKGVFYNADTEGFGVEQIRYQLLAELNWRPDMTDEEYEALMCELLEKEYGEGWDCVRDYITMWTKAQDTRRTNACWHAIGGNKAMWDNRIDPYYYDTHSGEMISLVEEAIRLASSELQQKRAEMLSCHIYYTTVYTRYYRAEAAGDTALMNTLEGYYATAMDRLRRLGYNPCGDDVYAPFRAGYWITTWDSTTSGGYAKTAKEAAETDWTDAKGNLLRGLSGFIGMNEYGVKE